MTYKIVKNFPQDLPLNAEGPFVSLYQTTQVFPLNKGNIITFKNLVKEATAELEKHLGRREVEEFVEPLQEIINDLDFWVYATQGIALYLNKDECLVFRTNQPVENQVFVSQKMHIRPAVAAFQNPIEAYVLALSKDNFKVYHCDFHSVEKVELDKSVETTLTAVLGDQKTDAFVGFGSTGTRNSTGLFYGQGGKKEEVDIDTEKFFRYADKTVFDELSKKKAIPVILTATSKNQTLFRKTSNNPYLMSEGIAFSPEALSEEQLCEYAREILQPEKQKRLEVLVDRARKALADQRAVDHIDDVAIAAISGRIETLLIDYDKRYMGDIDWQNLKITRKDANHGIDLFEEVTQVALKSKGQVYIIDAAMMPTKTGICAIYR